MTAPESPPTVPPSIGEKSRLDLVAVLVAVSIVSSIAAVFLYHSWTNSFSPSSQPSFAYLPAYSLYSLNTPQSVSISGSIGGVSYNQIITIILTFASGLLIGLAVKKGLTALILGIVGIVIAGYVGMAFVPKVSLTYEFHKWSSFFLTYISTVKFGAVQLTLSVILFLIGLAVGLWKG